MGRSYLNWQSIRRICVLPVFIAAVSLSGCDSENDRAWKKWRIEAGKVDYRCGMFNNYEFRINRAYLFFWPTYQGRSDWEVKGPPPLSCDAKLETVPMEAFWPGLAPAATHSDESLADPSRIEINLNSVSDREKWNLNLYLEIPFGKNGWKSHSSYFSNKNNLGLNYVRGPSWPFPDRLLDYYWIEETDGRVSIFIDCDSGAAPEAAFCTQNQFIPEMHAILKIRYREINLKHWKKISEDVNKFIQENAKLKRT